MLLPRDKTGGFRTGGRLMKANLGKVIQHVQTRDDIPILINAMGLHGDGVEVGTQCGLYAQTILGGTYLEKIFLVDCWDRARTPPENDSGISVEENREVEAKVRLRFEPHIAAGRVSIEKGFSVDVASRFPDKSVDFIYLDADHSEESVYRDLVAWYPKLRSGGLLSGHDYINNTPWAPTYIRFGVIEAVSRFRVELPDHEFFLTEEVIPSWLLLKP